MINQSTTSFILIMFYRWVNSPNPEKVMKDKLEGIDESISGNLTTSVSSKNSQREWTFLLKTKKKIRAVALLQDAHRNHFSLRCVCVCVFLIEKKKKFFLNQIIPLKFSFI